MKLFAIIETDAGLTVAETGPLEGPEETAVRNDGLVVDPGPFTSYEEAYEALLSLEFDEDEPQRG